MIKLNSFGALPQTESKEVVINNVTVTVKTSLAYEEILDMVQFAVNYIMSDRPFISAPIYTILKDIAFLKYYTDLDFRRMENTDCEPKEIYEMYDIIRKNNLVEKIKEVVASDEYDFYEKTLMDTITSLVQYRNSAAGMCERLAILGKTDATDLNKAIETLQSEDVHKVLELMEQMQ